MRRHFIAGAMMLACCSHGQATEKGLTFSVGEHGLDTLSFNGQSLLSSPKNGELHPAKSLIHAVVDSLFKSAPPAMAMRKGESDTLELSYAWGRVSCAYREVGENKLALQIDVANESGDKLDEVSLTLLELTFPVVPKGGTLEAGPWGLGFRGTLVPLPDHPQVIDSRFSLPIVRVDYENGALNFCADDLESTVGVSYTRNAPERTTYPFEATVRDINPRQTKHFNASLRFGGGGATVGDLSADLIENYRKKYPFQLAWTDHRPIGAMLLASSGVRVPTNPRRWIMHSGKIDITTEDGKRDFRRALLGLAEASIKILKETNAQGMITWDIEGQETPSACFYGDPRLTSILAPEMEFKGDDDTTTADAYFKIFRAAGLRVGVCIRPQQIQMENGKPRQQPVDDEQAVQILKDKIAYARQRWGCTLFYVDSTMMGLRPYKPEVFEALSKAYPDVLLIPEEKSMRYFACTAPLNFYFQRGVTTTPAGVRLVYPKAFSVLMATAGDRAEDHDSLVTAVRNGDILMGNCWYNNAGLQRIKKLYQEAAHKSSGSRSHPNYQ